MTENIREGLRLAREDALWRLKVRHAMFLENQAKAGREAERAAKPETKP